MAFQVHLRRKHSLPHFGMSLAGVAVLLVHLEPQSLMDLILVLVFLGARLTLDIENQQPNYYSDFITALRSLYSGGSKSYYITGAPQCVYPDASLGAALSSSPFE